MARRARNMGDLPSEREMRRMIDALWTGPRGPDDNLLEGYGSDDSAGDYPFGQVPGDVTEGMVPFPWARPKDHQNLYQHGIFWDLKPSTHAPIERPDVDEVRRRAEPMAKRIWENYSLLHDIASRHEALIQRRWDKKSKLKRREIIVAAWGSGEPMPKVRRPDLNHVKNRASSTAAAQNGYPNKHLFLWRTLTQEDLCKKEPFLLLLNARARQPPSVFAHSDLESAHMGIEVFEVAYPPVLKKCTMRFLGQTAEAYGELTSWDKDLDAESRLDRFRDVSPGEGLYILEIQDHLYRFLLDVCRSIIQDVDLSPAALSALPEAREPPAPTMNSQEDSGGNAVAQSLSALRYEATYHVPYKFNLERLQGILIAKVAEVEDKIWALREDPGFFTHTLHEFYDHRSELIIDEYGAKHPCLDPAYNNAFIGRVVGSMLAYYLPALELWAAVVDKLNQLAEIKARLFDSASPPIGIDDDLPYELELGFLSLILYLNRKGGDDVDMILSRAKWSPPMRYLFVREAPTASRSKIVSDTMSGMGSVTIRGSGAKPKTGSHGIEMDYIFALSAISEEDGRDTYGVATLIDELDRLTQQPEARSMVTPYPFSTGSCSKKSQSGSGTIA